MDQPPGIARTNEGLKKVWGGPRHCSGWDPSTMGMVRAGQKRKASSELVGVPRGGWAEGGWYKNGWGIVRVVQWGSYCGGRG